MNLVNFEAYSFFLQDVGGRTDGGSLSFRLLQVLGHPMKEALRRVLCQQPSDQTLWCSNLSSTLN